MNSEDKRNSKLVISYIENSLYDYGFAFRHNKGCQYNNQPNEKWISLSYTNRVLYTKFSTVEELNLYLEKLKKTKKEWLYIIGPSSRPKNQKEVIQQTEGFQHIMDWAGMALELTKLGKRKMNDLLDVKKVETLEEFKTWVDLYIEGFNMASSLKPEIHENYGQLLLTNTSPVQFYLGYYDGQPAVTTALHYNNDDKTVGVFEVATRPSLRRRGLASSVLQYLLEASLIQGYKWAVLHATEAGFSTYKKLGFETYCQFHVYSLQG